MDKSEIRLIVKDRILEMTDMQKEIESSEVSRQLILLLAWKSLQTLVSYNPMNDEVDISEVNNWAENQWKEVIIIDQKLSEVPNFEGNEIVCIVPGRAFTRDNKRLGRWMGFYDQLLEKNPQILPIGACFSCQIFPDLPQDTWDKEVSQVVFAWNTLE